MSAHIISIDTSTQDIAEEDAAYAAFCDGPGCTWRGRWVHLDEFVDGDADLTTLAALAEEEAQREGNEHLRQQAGPVVLRDLTFQDGVVYRTLPVPAADGWGADAETIRVGTVVSFKLPGQRKSRRGTVWQVRDDGVLIVEHRITERTGGSRRAYTRVLPSQLLPLA